MLFKELVELEAIEQNPARDIAKQATIKTIRETLTPTQREMVRNHLSKNHPVFWIFTQIFFHSGSRETELLRLKGKDVNLSDQTFKITVLKGKNKREVKKVIKDVVLGAWKEAMENCEPDQYVFSKGLVPGPSSIRPEQITRRWRAHVKKKLGITADFYAMKHLNTSETVEILSDEDAARQNSHTGTSMVVKIYDVNREDRQHARLKKVQNKL